MHSLPSHEILNSKSGLFVGVDLGTSGMKAVAVDSNGNVVARGRASYLTSRPEVGASEQDPHDWIMALIEIARQINDSTENRAWSVIGLSGMLPTLVTLNSRREVVGSAITWEDSRAEQEGNEFREAMGADHLYKQTGQWVDGRYLLPMFARICNNDPERANKSVFVVGAKDYLFYWLTGELLTDPSTASGYGCYDLHSGKWDASAIAKAHSISSCNYYLPEVAPSLSSIGLSTEAAKSLGVAAGLPVVLGAADSVLGALGMGVSSPGEIAYVGGTSTIILGISPEPFYDPLHRFIITPLSEPGLWGLEMDLLSTGSSVRWLSEILGMKDETALMESAKVADPDEFLIFLPFLAPGEQGALWDPLLTGSLFGLHIGSKQSDIAGALINGILIESRRCIATLQEIGLKSVSLCVSGGSANNPWFRQQLSNACKLPIESFSQELPDRSALGAAILAAQSLGIDICAKKSDILAVLPQEDSSGHWETLTKKYQQKLDLIQTQVI